ncbi:MAG: hypothetical protein HY689_12420 [Chloroflexi bacterium]|nr:hypothetical protein [Chloroflexota bacterium]
MQPTESKLAPFEAQLVDLWDRLVRTIGVHTVNVLMERAIWEASRRHPELALIERQDDHLDFVALEKSLAGRPESEIATAFNDLYTELLLILARLLGKEMALRLAEELQVKMEQERRPRSRKRER